MWLIRCICVVTLVVGACGTSEPSPTSVVSPDGGSSVITQPETIEDPTTSTTTQPPTEDGPPCDLIVMINEGDGDCVFIADELHLIYAAVAAELAAEGHVDGVIHILDRVVPVPELDARDAKVFNETGTLLNEATRSAIVATLTELAVDFAGDFDALQAEHCRRGTPPRVILFYGLGVIRMADGDSVETLVEFNNVNAPQWNVATLDRTVNGWGVRSVSPTGAHPAGDRCL